MMIVVAVTVVNIREELTMEQPTGPIPTTLRLLIRTSESSMLIDYWQTSFWITLLHHFGTSGKSSYRSRHKLYG